MTCHPPHALTAALFAATLSLTAWSQDALPATAFPAVDAATQKSRDETRQQILQSELATEKKAYDDANTALSAAISGRQLGDKIDALKQSVLDHQKNVEAIQGELANLDRTPSGAKAAPVTVQARAAATPTSNQRPAPYWDVYNRPQPQPADAQ
ncbi:hypothetical protein [Xanthomonas oryzae]|uniref:hypothetical protein n=1 Tax=Xanthomonas oryzae TaxID=347 RepID=UPI000B1CBC5D|nr:hypothetical protein [Xanthomonas oryzae]QIE18174.1 hypothetical protein IXO704_000135 [Xanthomonas oryzae pv. oryzae]UXV81053.1 hypothetical protein IXO842_023425 [Xanthomonas oryzae pv. oryzae]WJS77211.1 hypothetical protein BXO447_023330 [Xanthomonas oryzae pv. oryzae]